MNASKSFERRMALAINDYDRQALKGAEFQRQLRLAFFEGLLGEFLRDIVSPDHPEARQPSLLDESGQLRAAERQSSNLPLWDRFDPHNAFGLKFLKQLFQSMKA